ncbi:hypothetical protein SDC9_135308 [bioreactor metagenome]|uniref:Uncharacterized protein n=1 Tax=bioreactor metagenome TaxID=1076179 RepID=A0A645DG09_9ZZZZ
MTADGALGKQVCFANQLTIFAHDFQRTQQEIRAVLRKCNGVATGIDEAIFLGKSVIEGIQLCLLCLNFFLGIVLGLVFQQGANAVPQVDLSTNAALSGLGHLHRVHAAVFTVIEPVII